MARKDGPAYADKHPAGTRIDPQIRRKVQEQDQKGRLSCRAAHQIARELSVTPLLVGLTLDLLDYKITRCQLGLFGYQPDPSPVHPVSEVVPELATALQQAAPDKRISCADVWRVADSLKLPRMAAANACETLGLKIRPCQLGAF
ncbi:MAG: hypothetical protein WBG37_13070 [Desulfobacterales bacterium]